MVCKTKKNKTKNITQSVLDSNTNNVNKTRALLQPIYGF